MSIRKFFNIYFTPSFVHVLWLEFMLRLKSGVKIKIKNTLKCNLHCSYCTVDITDGRKAEYEELSADEWLKIIDLFPFKIRVIILLGGESFIRKDTPYLVNELMKRRIMVKMLTNQTYKRMTEITPSPYIKFLATYHKESDMFDYWIKFHKELKKQYRIKAWELDEGNKPQMIKGSRMLEQVKNWYEDEFMRPDFILAPNGEVCFCLGDLYRFSKGRHPKKQHFWRQNEIR